MNFRLNDTVQTRLGPGIFQGRYGVVDRETHKEDEVVALVRLPINEQTAPHLQDPNCLTPNASGRGLWLFSESELS